jgi:hypothetical protein
MGRGQGIIYEHETEVGAAISKKTHVGVTKRENFLVRIKVR